MKLRVLLFEDDPALRRLIAVLLQRRGHEVLEHASPADAPISRMERCACRQGEACADLVITDQRMPRATGLGFIQKQKALGCKAARKTLLMSGTLSGKEREEALALGCTVFAKPFLSEELIGWVEEVEGAVDPKRKLMEIPLCRR